MPFDDFVFHNNIQFLFRYLITISPGVIYLAGQLTSQPVKPANWLVNHQSSQTCQVSTLLITAFKNDSYIGPGFLLLIADSSISTITRRPALIPPIRWRFCGCASHHSRISSLIRWKHEQIHSITGDVHIWHLHCRWGRMGIPKSRWNKMLYDFYSVDMYEINAVMGGWKGANILKVLRTSYLHAC